MIAVTSAFPKAFGIWFKQLDRFDPASFERIVWHWPKEVMAPLGSVLRERKEKVDRSKHEFADLQPITIHFGGSIDRREVDGHREYTMDLYFARPGDVVVAKIDLKNGAVGIVPDWQNVVVTGHFAIYEPDRTKLVPEYLTRLIQTSFFKAHLWRNKVGAEGRKEVKLDFFESLAIPLPPLEVQRAIVARWQQARQAIAEAEERVKQLEGELPQTVLKELGIPWRESAALPKVFKLTWKDLDRWSVNYLARTAASASDLHRSKYPLFMLGDFAQVSYGIQKSPANRPGKNAHPYLRVANVQKGQLDLSEIKYIDVTGIEMETLRLKQGDLLVCEGNSADLVGRPAIWNDEIPGCVHQNHILKVRLDQSMAIPEYVLEYMQTQPARNYFRARAKFTTNLASINSNDLRELQIPLPPLNVQRDLMRRVAEGRAEIARERAVMQQRARDIEADIEALILGTKTL